MILKIDGDDNFNAMSMSVSGKVERKKHAWKK